MTVETASRRAIVAHRGLVTFLLAFWGIAELALNENMIIDLKSRTTSLRYPLHEEPKDIAAHDHPLTNLQTQIGEIPKSLKRAVSYWRTPTTEDRTRRAREEIPETPSSPNLMQSSQVPISATPLFPYHVLFGLSGNGTGFLHQFEASLKSVLLNAPLDAPVDIHLVADMDAYITLDGVFEKAFLHTFQTRNPITIHVYNVQPLLPSWKIFLTNFFRAHWKPDYSIDDSTYVHSIGAFFRLLANEILPTTVQKFLYLDSDAVLMTNMQELWKDVAANHPDATFHWGPEMCSGFMVLDNHQLPKVWELAGKGGFEKQPQPFDQEIFRTVNESYPENVGVLPLAWENSVANGGWRYSANLVEQRPDLGMMHFNGGAGNPKSIYERHDFLTINQDNPPPEAMINTWHLPHYYARMPWQWARYRMRSQIRLGEQGHPVGILHHTNLQPPSKKFSTQQYVKL